MSYFLHRGNYQSHACFVIDEVWRRLLIVQLGCLASVKHLDTAGLAKWHAEALAMDKRAYTVAATAYGVTPPARQAIP